MCGMFSGFGKTCPTDQDLRFPDADKSIPLLEQRTDAVMMAVNA
jgi:hypothetical protein